MRILLAASCNLNREQVFQSIRKLFLQRFCEHPFVFYHPSVYCWRDQLYSLHTGLKQFQGLKGLKPRLLRKSVLLKGWVRWANSLGWTWWIVFRFGVEFRRSLLSLITSPHILVASSSENLPLLIKSGGLAGA